jgi:transcriptional regulator with XRE-family HTH domain
MKEISNKIKELRAEKEITQQELADQIGVKRHNISDWEQGRTEPDISTIILLSKYFGVTTDYLLGVEE